MPEKPIFLHKRNIKSKNQLMFHKYAGETNNSSNGTLKSVLQP